MDETAIRERLLNKEECKEFTENLITGTDNSPHGINSQLEVTNTIQIEEADNIDKKDVIEYDNNNRVVFIGKHSSDETSHCKMGYHFIYNGDCLKEVHVSGNVEKPWKQMEFDANEMKEYDENGNLIYQGEYQGDINHDFSRDKESQVSEELSVYLRRWRDGVGTFYKNGTVYYQGHWEKGKPHGEGKLISENDVLCEGEWKNGLFEIENGVWLDFESNKMCGLYKNGTKRFEGEMWSGLPHGKGVYYNRDGSILCEGEWKNGLLDFGNGSMFNYEKDMYQLKNGKEVVVYEGGLANDYVEGYGRIVNKKGQPVIEGDWSEGILDLGGVGYVAIEAGEVVIYEPASDCFGCGDSMQGRKWDGENECFYTIHDSTDFNELYMSVSHIVIAENACNDMYGAVEFCELPILRNIVVKRNAMKNLKSLKICNCPVLEKLEVEPSEDVSMGAFSYVKKVELDSKSCDDFS